MPPRDLAEHRRLLLEDAGPLLRRALTGSDDGVPGFEHAVDAVHLRPGRDVSVGFRVWHGVGEERREEYLVATTADVQGTVATVEGDGFRLRVWRHPADPGLPSLGAAYDPTTVAGWLGTLGEDAAGLSLRSLVYRPMRRAVLRADAGGATWFVKVQRPRRHLEYLERMAVLSPVGITPPVVSVPAPGVSLTAAASGVSLAQSLAAWSMEGAPEPDPASLLGLLGALPRGVLAFPARRPVADTVRAHAESAAVELPERASEVASLADALNRSDAAAHPGPVVATHGDFHEANVFVQGGRATSVIDIETVGPGHLVDDLAGLLAHLEVLPALSPAHYERLPDLLPRWWQVFAAVTDEGTLRHRTAGVILGLLSGAGPEQAEARLNRALALLA